MAEPHHTARDGSRRAALSSAAKGSCDLLLTLSTRDPVAQLLGEASIGPGQLLEVRDDLEAMLGPEPADWRVRLADRGGGETDLEQLLAICRSADSHAYQLLEQLGVCCAGLRRAIIDRLRDEGTASLRNTVSMLARPPAATMSRSRRGGAVARPANGRPVRTARTAAQGIAPPRRGPSSVPGSAAPPGPPGPPGPSDPSPRRATDLLKEHRGPEPKKASKPEDSRREVKATHEAPRRTSPGARVLPARDAPRPATNRRRRTPDPDELDPHQLRQPPDRGWGDPGLAVDEEDAAQPRRVAAHPRRAAEARRAREPDVDPGRADEGPPAQARRRAAFDRDTDAVEAPSGDARRATGHAVVEQPSPAEVEARRVDPKTLPPLHGRDRELAQLADALGRRRVRVPLLVGAPGCGRTLLAKHLAAAFRDPVFHLEATGYDDEESLAADLQAIERQRGIVIFDDLDRVPSEAAPPFLGALSHAWTTGHPRVLTIVSPEGHGRLGGWLPGALESADAIRVDALQGPPLVAAVAAAAPGILSAHGVSLAPDAKLGELTRWADRYLTGLAMPGRALDLLDLSCARAVRCEAESLTRAVWLDIIAERSGLTAARIEAGGDQELLDLEQRLARNVVGHENVTAAIARLVRRNRAGFGGHRPVLTSLLLGPSGVGKTELAKSLAHALFDREDALHRLDMSEYAEPHAVARVVGAPPGYVGHEQGGALTDPLVRRPHCVVLLDEIEKAHRDVHQLLLQVFDEGRLTDGRGRTVDFRHAAIIMTSNLGADRIQRGRDGPVMDIGDILETARKAFPVELWNRIEAPLVMQPLTKEQMSRICRRLAAASSERLFKERGIRYALSDRACNHLVGLAGRDPSLGARPLRHLLVREVESAIADAVLRGQLRAGTQVSIDIQRNRIVLR